MANDREDKIRDLAFGLWLAAGQPDGLPDEFWFAAEFIVDGNGDHTPPPAAPPIRGRDCDE